MTPLKNNKPKAGMKLHIFIATGGNPKNFNSVNKTETLRSGSKRGSTKK